MLLLPLSIKASEALDQLLEKRQRLHHELKNQAPQELFGIQLVNQASEIAILHQIMDIDHAIIQKLKLRNSMEDSQVYSDAKKYKQIVLSQEKDIQALKAALSRKNQEYNQAGFDIRKYQHGTWIFFLGMLLFCGLYLKDKLHFKIRKGGVLSLIPFEPR